MVHYPLVFGFRDLVVGHGFLAGITVKGRAILEDDGEAGCWMYGVNPGGLSAGGPDVGEAQRSFRETYRTVLFEIAADCPNFDSFRAEVERFFQETSAETLELWERAVAAVRAGETTANWLQTVDAASTHFGIEVALAEKLDPSVNQPDEPPALAAA